MRLSDAFQGVIHARATDVPWQFSNVVCPASTIRLKPYQLSLSLDTMVELVLSLRIPGNGAPYFLHEVLDAGANSLWQSRTLQESWHPTAMSTLEADNTSVRPLYKSMRLQPKGSTVIAPATCRRQPLQDGGYKRQVRDFHGARRGHRIPCSSRRIRRKPSSTFSGYAALLQ